MRRTAIGRQLLLASAILCGIGAHAQDTKLKDRLSPDAMFVQHAQSARSHSTTVGLIWALPYEGQWKGGEWSTYIEASVGRWSVEVPGGPRAVSGVSQIGLTPVFRWSPAPHGYFIEGGIGLNVIGPTYRAGKKRFSTAFNFGDHLAAGWIFKNKHELALRVQHFSNAGIKQPNPGEDFIQLRWTAPIQ